MINKLNAEMVRVLKLPDVREKMAALGSEPIGNTPEAFAQFLTNYRAAAAQVVKEAGLEPQ